MTNPKLTKAFEGCQEKAEKICNELLDGCNAMHCGLVLSATAFFIAQNVGSKQASVDFLDLLVDNINMMKVRLEIEE